VLFAAMGRTAAQIGDFLKAPRKRVVEIEIRTAPASLPQVAPTVAVPQRRSTNCERCKAKAPNCPAAG
jgi:hypothetical protein